jgi:adenosylmethionine-8-amino-7-oxononanoate aminotransferase
MPLVSLRGLFFTMNLSERDQAVIWHPYTQMKTAAPPIAIVKGEGAYLWDDKGKKYIDAISSWWVNLHGHAHPYIAEKVAAQLKELEHVIFAGFTHRPAVELAERLLAKLPGKQSKVFYSDNGSTAVEVALKMAFQYWRNKGKARTKVIAFRDSYHGDTFGAMSVSGRGSFTEPFFPFLFDVHFIEAPGIETGSQTSLQQLQTIINENKDEVAAFIFEPCVQGTAGMLMHSHGGMNELMSLCRRSGIITISDEVMTGFGRTGKLFASGYFNEEPDIFCLSKGITGGTMAMGFTTCTDDIYNAFLSDDKLKTFFHGHSYTANPVSCAAALASLDIIESRESIADRERVGKKLLELSGELKKQPKITNVRCLGAILAFDISTGEGATYFSSIRDKAYNFFLDRGVLLRPLGNVIYMMPPYCTSDSDLDYIYRAIVEFLDSL